MVSQALLSQDVSHLPLPFASLLIILTNWFAVIYLEILLVASHLIARLHTVLGCFLPGLFAGNGLSRGSVPPASCGASPSTGIQRWIQKFRAPGWTSEPAPLPAEQVGWQVRADRALDLQPVPAECQGPASFWFTLCHSRDEMSANVTPFLTSRLETH